MQPLELASKYMEILFYGKELDDLHQIFASDLLFSGPLFEFDTAEAYIDSLKSDPPSGFKYSILQSYENESSACLIYQFSKPGISVPMAQMFEVSNEKISRIILIFDKGAFVENNT